jgi:hypothetical protein
MRTSPRAGMPAHGCIAAHIACVYPASDAVCSALSIAWHGKRLNIMARSQRISIITRSYRALRMPARTRRARLAHAGCWRAHGWRGNRREGGVNNGK